MTAQQAADAFLRHRKVTEQLCALMPDAGFGRTAFEGGMSFGRLATHLAYAGDLFLAAAEGVPFERPDPAAVPTEPETIRALLARKTQEQEGRIRRLGKDLTRPVDWRGTPVPLDVLLGRMREHEAHHKGQMLFLIRMAGVGDELFYTLR